MEGLQWEGELCCPQFNVAQVNNTALAAQAQPQPATPWYASSISAGYLAANAVVLSPRPSAAFKESWFSGGARWCKPSNQDAVTGPGALVPHTCHCTAPARRQKQRLPTTYAATLARSKDISDGPWLASLAMVPHMDSE